jgi:hypothetical protein
MTDPNRLSRRGTLVPALVMLTVLATALAGCGQQRQDTTTVTAGDKSAVNTCAQVAAAVQEARGTVLGAAKGSLSPAAAGRRLAEIGGSLQAAADSSSDDVVQQSVQDVVDSIAAYLAVLPDRAVGAYEDVESDVSGRLNGFRRTCPVGNAGFDAGTGGWAATSASTGITRGRTGRNGGGGLDLTNLGSKRSTIGVTDSPNWVDRTWRGTYRAGVWARASSGAPTLTLVVREKSGKAVVGEARQSVALGPGWTFVGVGYDVTGHGGALDVRVTAAGVAPGAEVHIDGLAVARG